MEMVFDDNTERGFVVVRAESENGRETGKRGKGKKLFLSPLHLFSLSSPLSNNFFSSLAQAPRLALRLEQREDVALADGALDVAHDEAVLVVEELDADLGDLFLSFEFFFFWRRRGGKKVSEHRRREREREIGAR